ncbi:hypothetical protein N199_03325 [Helicobacter pylori UM038]|uniref:Uncharacterized protein n=1 Tax=Helicobacter pylori UM038 TaxID=1352343 RepID=A0AAV3JMZ4_HELPX|nr:hypothetical protein N199_03325 [Helicobacter pylori UM038]
MLLELDCYAKKDTSKSCIKRVCFKKLIEPPPFKSGFGKSPYLTKNKQKEQ